MTELECQIEQDDGNYFILYIVVQRALEDYRCVFAFVGTSDSTVTSITLASIPFPVHCA
jgi:hypothetical protein